METRSFLPISISAIIFRGENQSSTAFPSLSISAGDTQLDAGAALLMQGCTELCSLGSRTGFEPGCTHACREKWDLGCIWGLEVLWHVPATVWWCVSYLIGVLFSEVMCTGWLQTHHSVEQLSPLAQVIVQVFQLSGKKPASLALVVADLSFKM